MAKLNEVIDILPERVRFIDGRGEVIDFIPGDFEWRRQREVDLKVRFSSTRPPIVIGSGAQ